MASAAETAVALGKEKKKAQTNVGRTLKKKGDLPAWAADAPEPP